jgi:hypothetical protein
MAIASIANCNKLPEGIMEKSQKMDDLGVPPGTPMTLESCKWVFHRKNQRPGQNGKINPTEIDQDSGKIDSYIYIYIEIILFFRRLLCEQM